MKIQEIRQLGLKKLLEALTKVRRELAVKRFHVRTGQNQNTAQLKGLRRKIARMLTVLPELKQKNITPKATK